MPQKDEIILMKNVGYGMTADYYGNYEIYDLIFWYSLIQEQFKKLFDSKTKMEDYEKIKINLNEYNELEPIMSFIDERELQSNKEKRNFSEEDKEMVNHMLGGILLYKIYNYRILDLEGFNYNEIVETLLSRINYPHEIPNEEYIFTYVISGKYPKNLKIKLPEFYAFDAFFFFYQYDSYNDFKLNNIFNEIQFGYIGDKNNIAKKIVSEYKNDKNIYENMVDLSKEIVKQIYNKITGKVLDEKNNPDISKFLIDEVEVYKKQDDIISKELLKSIVQAFMFIENFQNKIFYNQYSKKYQFKLDDFYSLLDNKKRLLNCANIFKKEKELKESDKNKILFPPSLLFYLNNNQKFVDELFNYINNSDNSIIKDLNSEKKENINYVPFWLFIFRNISSLNYIQYNRQDINTNITDNIISRIKNKLSDCLKNKKPLNFRWLNILLENISFEILEPVIHYFYYFFNSLIMNLNISEENLKDFIIKEIEKYIFEVIDSLFNDKINMTLNQDIYDDQNELVLKFTKNPCSYLKEKLKVYIDDQFKENMIINGITIQEFNNNFILNLEEISSILITNIKRKNEELLKNELQKVNENIIKKNEKILYALISKCLNIEKEENFIFLQITKEESDIFKNLINYSNNYKRYNRRLDKYKLVIIHYEFNTKNFNNYSLFFKNKKIELDNKRSEFSLITNQDLSTFNIQPAYKNAITLKTVASLEFFMSNIAEISIDNYVHKKVKLLTEKDLTNPPEILFSNKNLKQFCAEIEKAVKASKNLSEIFKKIVEEKNKDENIIKELEKEIELLLKQLIKIKEILILKPNNAEDLIDISKKMENIIFEFYSNLNNYYENYKRFMKEKLRIVNSGKIFKVDFSLPKLPDKINKSGIIFSNMDKNAKNLIVPIINFDSEGKNLICCYNPLDINLGLICPTLYSKENNHYIINIISFVNEDLKIKLVNKDDEDEEKNGGENILFNEGIENKEPNYLSIPKEIITKGENIKLFVDIPQIFNYEKKIERKYKLNIESFSGKKLNLPINLSLTTIPFSVLLSCKEYNLKKYKEENEYENNDKIKQYFLLDTCELIEGETINFELLNYKEKDIDFYISAESLEKKYFRNPDFLQRKTEKQF